MMLEIQRHDWKVLSAQGTAEGVPQALVDLICAETLEQAESAYWRIDNTVVVQGLLFEAALPTVSAIVSSMYGCTEVARPLVLELLVQLTSGSNVPGGSDSTLAQKCRGELLFGAGYFLYVLEHGALEERAHCVDLLGLCVHADRSLLSRVRWYFQNIRERGCSKELEVLIENTLSDVEHP